MRADRPGRALRAARRAAVAAAMMTAAACGGASGLGLTSEDNNPDKLHKALALRAPETPAAPANATGKPLVFASLRGSKREGVSPSLLAFDLDGEKVLWKVDTAVRSKVVVGGEFLAHTDEQGLVARRVTDGAELWRRPVGVYLGGAADGRRVYYTTEDRSGERPVWHLIALDGTTGAELWRTRAPGTLGAPAASRGLVFSPFLKQWLVILDARTGAQVARIRGIDEEISFVRTTDEAVYFGSRAGVFLLDRRAHAGQRGLSTYGRAKVPDELARSHYHWDAFDAVQTGYSAYDRNRLLWRGAAAGDDLGFADDLVVVHTYRFFFAFNTETGALQWAYNHPRYDIVASAHLGEVIGVVSGLGEVAALDAETGRQRYAARFDGQVLGATFDAAGWAPAEEGDRMSAVAVLASIARDRDARFNDIKRFAVTALAQLAGGDVTRDLLEMIQSERTPRKLHDTAVDVLISRKEPEGIPHLLSALQVRWSFLDGTRPRAVGVIARALGAMGDVQMDPALRAAAVEALLAQLYEPQTPVEDLVAVIAALGQVGAGGELAPLSSFVLAYRGDPAFASRTEAVTAAMDVLLARGGAAGRELVSFVAADARTQPPLADHAARALSATAAPDADAADAPDAPGGGAPGPASADAGPAAD